MRTEGIDMAEITNVMIALNNYTSLANSLLQIDQTQKDGLNELWERVIKHSRDGKYMDNTSFSYWNKYNLHVVMQMWGSTACGWGGMGGAAMTESYTVIIDALPLSAIFVYYNGKLAYIADSDEKMNEFRNAGFKFIPAFSDTKGIKLFYKNKH